MKLIGITGGVGAGKSEIISYIKSRVNCKVYLADEVAHDLEKPGGPCFDKIVKLLGPGILKDGLIDNSLMAKAMFADKKLVSKVNEIVHPAVKEFFLKEIELERQKNDIDYFFIEAALLIEDGYEKIMDELWYIYASEDTRRKRLKDSRGYSDEKINSIFSKQLKEEIFREKCHFVIDNDGDLKKALSQIDEKFGG